MTFQGTVTVRKALQLSLNVPAIALLDRVGSPPAVVAAEAGRRAIWCCRRTRRRALRWASAASASRCRIWSQLYAGLARLGTPCRCAKLTDDCQRRASRSRLMDPVAAWQVGNVLIGTPPPENAARNRIAFKTGTSYGYRDAWSVGFDGRITIGVWVGRPDGAPVPGLVGRTAAAPILFDAFARTGKLPAAAAEGAEGRAGGAAMPNCRCRCGGSARSGNWSGPASDQAPRIQFPLNGSRIDCRLTARGSVRDAGQGRRRRAADDHAGERRVGR